MEDKSGGKKIKLSPFPHGNLNLGEKETIHTIRNAVRIMNNDAQEGNGAYQDKGSCFKKVREAFHLHPQPDPTSCLILPSLSCQSTSPLTPGFLSCHVTFQFLQGLALNLGLQKTEFPK